MSLQVRQVARTSPREPAQVGVNYLDMWLGCAGSSSSSLAPHQHSGKRPVTICAVSPQKVWKKVTNCRGVCRQAVRVFPTFCQVPKVTKTHSPDISSPPSFERLLRGYEMSVFACSCWHVPRACNAVVHGPGDS